MLQGRAGSRRLTKESYMPQTRVGDLDIVWDVAGPSDGEPVLMINGLGAVHGSWQLQLAALAERYRVYSFDNRDVGETGSGTDTRPYATERFARDAAGLVEALEIGSVHVIGASMGGAIAQELAIARPDLVRSVQIACSWAWIEPWLGDLLGQWDEMFAAMGALAWARSSWLWVFTHRWYENPEWIAALVDGVRTAPHAQTATMFSRQCRAALDFDARGRLGAIRVPAHVIAGDEDIFTPPRYAIEIANAIPGATLTILPEVGHGMFWEAPDAFNASLQAFLDASAG
jgi:pimeloyl-ACP methyl ester carboxylesterase